MRSSGIVKVNVSPTEATISDVGEERVGSLSVVVQDVSAKLITVVMIRSNMLEIAFIISELFVSCCFCLTLQI